MKAAVNHVTKMGSNTDYLRLTEEDKDVEDIMIWIEDINECGIDAFNALVLKAKVSRDIFQSIRDFAEDVVGLNDISSVRDINIMSIPQKVKDLWGCIHLSGRMKKLPEAIGNLIKSIIASFK